MKSRSPFCQNRRHLFFIYLTELFYIVVMVMSVLIYGCINSLAFASDLPSGGQIVAGSGSISKSGKTMTINQTTDKMIANWQEFSIGKDHTVNFKQPSSSSVALNRVLGSDVSCIQGNLNANGRVFLINPNGVLFDRSAQVDVGGILASTHDITNQNFLNNKYSFSGSSLSSVINRGKIKVSDGGTAAFIAARIENSGSIEASAGNILMGAGNKVVLDFGDSVKLEVEKGALNAQIEQGGAIKADNGVVYLCAKAFDELSSAVINHTGITEARSLGSRNGEIWLMGDMDNGEVNIKGSLDAEKGFVETSAAKVKIADGSQIRSGHWLIDPKDFTIAASNGDMTGSTLSGSLASGDVTIQSSSGNTDGNGDIFVKDDITWNASTRLTLSAERNIEILSDITAQHASGKLALEYGQGSVASGNTATYDFGLTSSGFTGKINLQAGQNFSTKLGSDGPIIDYTVITSLGNEGDENKDTVNSLQGIAYSGKVSGSYVLGADIDASGTSTWNYNGALGWNGGFCPIGVAGGTKGSIYFTGRFDGLGHTISNLSIQMTDYSQAIGVFGYLNGASISNTGVNGGLVDEKNLKFGYTGGLAGFAGSASIANCYCTAEVKGEHANSTGGLVGTLKNSSIKNSFASGNVTGSIEPGIIDIARTGGLVGIAQGSFSITDSFASGNIQGAIGVGGLVGSIDSGGNGEIKRCFASGNLENNNLTMIAGTGGLVGIIEAGSSLISDSYARGNIVINDNNNPMVTSVGGLVGQLGAGNTVQNTYSTGSINIGSSATVLGHISGLVGSNSGSVVKSFWDTETSGQSGSDGGTGKKTSEMQSLSTFTDAGWDIDDIGGTSKIWRIYDGQDYPILRWALTPLTIDSTADSSKAYDGLVANKSQSDFFTISSPYDSSKVNFNNGTAGQKNAGAYTVSIYSTQDGYDLIGTRSAVFNINRRKINLTGTKVYDGTTSISADKFKLGNLVSGEELELEGFGLLADKNAGTSKPLASYESFTLKDGTNGLASNYTLSGGTHTATVIPKDISANYTAKDKIYDGTKAAAVETSLNGIIGNDAAIGTATGEFEDKNPGTDKTVTISGSISGADAGNYNLTNASDTSTADIIPRPVTVIADSKHKTQGEPGPEFTFINSSNSLGPGFGPVTGESLVGSLVFVNVSGEQEIGRKMAGRDLAEHSEIVKAGIYRRLEADGAGRDTFGFMRVFLVNGAIKLPSNIVYDAGQDIINAIELPGKELGK